MNDSFREIRPQQTAFLRPLAVLFKILSLIAMLWHLPAWSEPDSASPLELQIRVHLVEFQYASWLTSRLEPEEIEDAFEEINKVWQQADIVWRIESIVEHVSIVTADQLPRHRRKMGAEIAAHLPFDRAAAGIWNAYFVRRLGNIPGFYHSESLSVVMSEIDPFGGVGLNGAMGRIFAHELGHSLGLEHVPCTRRGNLMSADCASANRTRLEQKQVSLARAVAELGRPFGALVTPIDFLIQRSDKLGLTLNQRRLLSSIGEELHASLGDINENARQILKEGQADMASGAPDMRASRERHRRLAELNAQGNALLDESLARLENILDARQRSLALKHFRRFSELMTIIRSGE